MNTIRHLLVITIVMLTSGIASARGRETRDVKTSQDVPVSDLLDDVQGKSSDSFRELTPEELNFIVQRCNEFLKNSYGNARPVCKAPLVAFDEEVSMPDDEELLQWEEICLI